MIGSMRHRPTAELSPSLYLDKHCSESPILSTDSPKSDIISKASRISPVLSSLHPSNVSNCFSQSSRVQRNDFKSKYSGQLTGLNSCQEITKSGRYINHRKIRKKSKRETRFQMNGNIDQNFHSLKVTIRRTYKSNKMENGICAIVNPPDGGSNHDDPCQTSNHTNNVNPVRQPESQSFNKKITEVAYNPELLSVLENSRHFVDSSISTVESATLTEPNLLGPCEPGTKVVVEGVVWLEATGMLVLSLHWRGRNYMGTLMDSSKQTFAPTCMDKGIASALNLLRGRKSWCDPHRGYQTRGLHHFHHLRHHRRGGGHGTGVSMTTRSASAAAAAASQDSTEGSVGLKDQSVVNDPYSTECIDQPYVPLETNCSKKPSNIVPSDIPLRGAKGRKRRGAGRRPVRSIGIASPPSECSMNNTLLHESKQIPSDDVDNQATLITGVSSTNLNSKLPLSCPFSGCEKRFSDILSMRYHFTMGHSTETIKVKTMKESLVEPTVEKVKWMKTEDFDDNLEISVCDISATSSPPPKLARAHGTKDRSSDSNETSLVLTNGDDLDDNIDPPKLHRVVSLPVGGGDTSPSKFDILHHASDIHDEPPAASPAYSDISDDGTLSPATNIPLLNLSTATVDIQNRSETISNSSPISSSNLSNHPSTSQGYIDVSRRLNLSPLILSACSPTVLGSGEPTKLYFPASLFSPSLKGVSNIFYQTTSPTIKCIDKHNLENGLQSSTNNSPMLYSFKKESPSRSVIANNNSHNNSCSSKSSLKHDLSSSQSLYNSAPLNHDSSRQLTLLSVSPGLVMTEQNSRPSSTGSFISNPLAFCVSRNSPIPPRPGAPDQEIISPHNNHHSLYHHHQRSALSKSCE
ncbi:Zinc finger protein [Schistosoma japonicum]|uniref:Zinc finger protein n=1 Tax=Schistosoma japonicum TaxID=6182 RepID=A0A4Z2DYT6_SCHJA|nr:Zinc finger protein 608 [Schistosoma japonicum]TNN21400.1 Zinc finger protein [Schistosoma japonicum]